MTDTRPLVLDVDGTFLKTDLLFETFWAGLGRDPLATLAAAARHVRDPARLKAELVEIAPLRTDLMPVNPEIAAMAEEAMSEGIEVCLASASDRRLVSALAADYGLSARVFASDGVTNLKGEAKAGALIDAFGRAGFDYAGNEAADLPVWRAARAAVVVGEVAEVTQLETLGQPVARVPGGWSAAALWKAMRPHQ